MNPIYEPVVYDFDREPEKHFFGESPFTRAFSVFPNQDGKFSLFKDLTNRGKARRSEAFWSEMLSEIGHPTVKNRIARVRVNLSVQDGITSEIVSKPGSRLRHLHDVFPELFYSYQGYNPNLYFRGDTVFQNLNLQEMHTLVMEKYDPEFEEGLVKSYMAAMLTQNEDMQCGHNVSVRCYDDGRAEMAEEMDFSLADHPDVYPEYRFRHVNVKFLKKHYRKPFENFLDSLTALRDSPRLVDICDVPAYTPLDGHLPEVYFEAMKCQIDILREGAVY